MIARHLKGMVERSLSDKAEFLQLWVDDTYHMVATNSHWLVRVPLQDFTAINWKKLRRFPSDKGETWTFQSGEWKKRPIPEFERYIPTDLEPALITPLIYDEGKYPYRVVLDVNDHVVLFNSQYLAAFLDYRAEKRPGDMSPLVLHHPKTDELSAIIMPVQDGVTDFAIRSICNES